MGCGMSTEEKEGKLRNEEIENQLKRDKMLQRNEIKMLLLGTFPCCPPRYLSVRPALFVLSHVANHHHLQELVSRASRPSSSR